MAARRILFLMLFILGTCLSTTLFASDNREETSLVAFCTSCHGTGGAGPGVTIPTIGGQTHEYLTVAMSEIKDKERYSTMMQIIAQGYNPDETERIVSWFARQEWQNSDNEINQSMAQKGKLEADSCSGCHGDMGEGMGTNPRIAGQHSNYLFYSMQEYKKQVRNNEGNAPMMDMVIDMTDGQLKNLSEYYSGLK